MLAFSLDCDEQAGNYFTVDSGFWIDTCINAHRVFDVLLQQIYL